WCLCFFFFFSSRRRHTRFSRDWSSDVCSSDLFERMVNFVAAAAFTSLVAGLATVLFSAYHFQQTAPLSVLANVMVLPVLSFVIMPFGAIGVAAMALGIEAPFLLLTGWGIDRMIDVA